MSLTEALDLTTPTGRTLASMLAAFAEFEREVLREGVVPVWLPPGRTANV